jgi:hypothetical protein
MAWSVRLGFDEWMDCAEGAVAVEELSLKSLGGKKWWAIVGIQRDASSKRWKLSATLRGMAGTSSTARGFVLM